MLDWFKKKKEEPQHIDTLDATNITLSDLDVGYIVDFDLASYEVKDMNIVTEDGEETVEWQLENPSGDVIYLERYEDDEVEWSVSRKVPTSFLDDRDYDLFNDDNPPGQINYEGRSFYLDEEGAAAHSGEEFLYWTYVDKNTPTESVTVEQWDEDEFEASFTTEVNEYNFSNIASEQSLP